MKLKLLLNTQVEGNLRPEMKHTIEEYDPADPSDPVTAAWDDTQINVRETCTFCILSYKLFKLYYEIVCCLLNQYACLHSLYFVCLFFFKFYSVVPSNGVEIMSIYNIIYSLIYCK